MKKSFDLVLFITVLLLVFIGIMMVFSSSYYYTMTKYDNKFFYFKKDLMFAAVGIVFMMVFAVFDYRRLRKFSVPLIIASIIALGLIFTKLGVRVNGSRRWLDIGFNFMPSEFAKLSIIIFCANSMSNYQKYIKNFIYGILPYFGLLGVFGILIMLQPNFSTFLTITLIVFAMLFVAGMKVSHLLGLGALGVAGAYALAMSAEYRMKRMLSFLDPFANPLGDGYQVVQSFFALGSGGVFGVGVGQSTQNKLYIPEPQNDFIFATLGEELGFIGAVLVLILFLIVIYRGIKIAINCPELFGTLLATGITAMIAVQVMVNISVTTSLVPVTGVPLPFISYGGTYMLVSLSAMGILLNISKHQET